MNSVNWTKKALKQLKRVHRSEQKRIVDSVGGLKDFPNVPNIKALNNHQHDYRLRVGNYRVFFQHEAALKIVKIEEVRKRDERTY